MKKIYIVRHGQTDWNKALRRQGRQDIELNETGIEQAHIMKDKLKDVNFDICYSSPLKRARKTAEIITNGKCDIVEDDLITEQSFGKLEGVAFLPNEPHNTHWHLGMDHQDENYEELEQVFERAAAFLDKIKKIDAENILIVSHGCFLKTLHYTIQGYDENTDLCDWFIENCSVDIYEI